MIPATPARPPSLNENANPKELGIKTDFLQSWSSLWGSVSWVFTAPRLLTASPPEIPLRCSPRSYSQEMNALHRNSTNLQLRSAYLKKALETIPLEVLQTSVYFYGHDNLDLICKLLKDKPFKKIYEKLCSFPWTRQANSGSDDSRVGVPPTKSEIGSVSKAGFFELLDRLLAVRKCAASAVRNFLVKRLQIDHTCLPRFLTGADKVT